ncbi:MAG: PD-(D/E)XK nuclease family protein [SAR202 cluster bacterium]|jgi:hypothetical protein|nr:PD-(D/E)XK nuclease family protein [SAR202 cluster bacterium]|tara:strand:+ start:904 stop:1650 length:747 start_codon:yes stop_codon:yes gene_type:complete
MPRKRNLYDPLSSKPYKLSRSKVELFMGCPRCFYLDRRLGVSRPSGFPFNLNSAVDHLLKIEFDQYRSKGTAHPYMKDAGIEAIPFQHENLDVWRENFKGVSFQHDPTNFHLFGAVDDLWQSTTNGKIIVVDYKATSKNGEVSLDADWQDGYKRQMEFYQWLLRKNGLDVSDVGYFVYCNGRRDMEQFSNHLEFKIKVLPYSGSDDWVEPTIIDLHQLLGSDVIPEASPDCEYCVYINDSREMLGARQ